MKHINLIGPQVMRLRAQRGWTQDRLVERLNLAGWSISKPSLSKLEVRMLRVADHHLFFLAKIFQVPIKELFPEIDPQDPNLQQTINRLMSESSWGNEV